jgi:integrase
MAWINWQVFTPHRITALLSTLYESSLTEESVYRRRSPNTVNGYLVVIKGVMKVMFQMERITPSVWLAIDAIAPFRNAVPVTGRMVSSDEMQELEQTLDQIALDKPNKAVRDRAILSLGFYLGLRKHEYSNLLLEDYDPIQGTLVVTGKGGRIARMELSDALVKMLNHWIDCRGLSTGTLFRRILKNDRITEQSLSKEGIRHLYHYYQQQSGIEHLTSHDARRTFVSNILDDPEIDPVTARDLARHASFETTAQYDRRTGQKRREVLNRLMDKRSEMGR